jgi:hypothetical protein
MVSVSKDQPPKGLVINAATKATSNPDSGAKGAAFVDVGSLTSIFHREGGVWFGDDGTLKETVIKGNIASDSSSSASISEKLFLEAEKLGIDIRPQVNVENMTFSFFDQTVENDSNNNSNDNSGAPFASGFALPNTNTNALQALSDSNVVANVNDSQPTAENIKVSYLKPIAFIDTLKTAKLFCRKLEVEEIKELWKMSREKYVSSYKQRRKDVLKRAKAMKTDKGPSKRGGAGASFRKK